MESDNEFLLTDKVIVVTGGTGILGEAFMTGIAKAGGTVGILGRNRKLAEERASKINLSGGKAIALCADVTRKSDLANAKKLMLDNYGKIDGLVNAAGGNIPEAIVQEGEDLFNLNCTALNEVIQLNLFGTILPTQVFGEAIKKNGSGSIVNISSMASQTVITKVLGYSLAKSAIDNYTRWFAVELGKRFGEKIRMNAIAPGFFLTDQNRNLLTDTSGALSKRGNLITKKTPFSRFGRPAELVGTLIWLLSDASRFVTGTVINVDGGFSIYSGV